MRAHRGDLRIKTAKQVTFAFRFGQRLTGLKTERKRPTLVTDTRTQKEYRQIS